MFKRLFWLTVGVIVGLGSSIWAQRRVRQAVNRLAPEQVRRQVSWSARTLLDDVRAAAAEGRTAMRDREASLRADLTPRSR